VPKPLRDPDAVDRFLKRRRVVRRTLLAAVVLLTSTVVVGNFWQRRLGGDDWARFDRKTFAVRDVLAGDVVLLEEPGGRLTSVHLLGVAAPDAEGFWSDESRAALRSRVGGRDVMLKLPALAPRSADGMPAAYFYLTESAESVNHQMVADGSAYADRRTTHALHKQYEQSEGDARRKHRGIWKDVRDDQQPAWRQAWLHGLKAAREAEGQQAP
jgi:endonuclease YncB( thermonuclease family)